MFNPESNLPESIEEIIDFLILNGGLEFAGINSKNGEVMYNFTPKVKELMPELYEDHMQSVNHEVMFLWEQGFINLDLLQDDPVITLTEKAFNPEEVSKLDLPYQYSLQEMRRILYKGN